MKEDLAAGLEVSKSDTNGFFGAIFSRAPEFVKAGVRLSRSSQKGSLKSSQKIAALLEDF